VIKYVFGSVLSIEFITAVSALYRKKLGVHVHCVQVLQRSTPVSSSTTEVPDPFSPALKRFKYLSTKMAQSTSHHVSSSAQGTVTEQLDHYLAEVQHTSADVAPAIATLFWKQKSTVYNLLAPVAEDVVCAPASQAYVERIFSVCGILCSGRRSSMQQSLEMRACLKLNQTVLSATGFDL